MSSESHHEAAKLFLIVIDNQFSKGIRALFKQIKASWMKRKHNIIKQTAQITWSEFPQVDKRRKEEHD